MGVNGSGKTTLFDAFDFLRDSISVVANALGGGSIFSMASRDGFDRMRTRGETGPIEIEMDFLAPVMGVERPVNYLLQVGKSENGNPHVEREALTCPLSEGPPVRLLDFSNGRGGIIDNEAECAEHGDKPKMREELQEPHLLAAANPLLRYKTAGVLRQFVESWNLSNFQNVAARMPADIGDHKHLDVIGGNLAGFLQFMQDKHADEMAAVAKKMSRRVPGFGGARAKPMNNGEIGIEFTDAQWKEPFDVSAMSGGTLKMLGMLSLLHDPEPSPLLCVEEPEKEMYPHLLGELVEDFRRYARRSGGNALVSTHSYELLNAAEPEEVFLLEKRDGATNIRRAGDDEKIRRLVDDEGDVMGRLWRMGRLSGGGTASCESAPCPIAFVEGASEERKFLRAFLPHLGFEEREYELLRGPASYGGRTASSEKQASPAKNSEEWKSVPEARKFIIQRGPGRTVQRLQNGEARH